MLFWIMVIAMALGVGVALALPVLRRRASGAVEAAEYDLQVYRDQLSEVDRDAERGVLSSDEATRARTEISRRVLEAGRAAKASAAPATAPEGARGALIAASALALAGAFWLYGQLGAPGLKDQPIKARIAESNVTYDARPDQATAEAEAAAELPTAEPDPRFAELLAQLRTKVAEHPDDPEGLAFLADSEARMGNYRAAYEAQDRRIQVLGPKADAEDFAILGELKARAAGGLITLDAETNFETALKLDHTNARARFYVGLLMAQNGRQDRAFPVWENLLREGPETAPWIPVIRSTIGDLAWMAGETNYTPPTPRATGPSLAELDAAAALPADQREKVLRGPIEALNQSMAQNGGTPQEWSALIAGLGLLGDTDRAQAIYDEAMDRFAQAPMIAPIIRDGAIRAGLIEGELSTPAPGPSAEDMANAAEMSDEDRQEMINTMVERLETRLMNEGGTPEEWARLFNTLTVLGQPERAQSAWAKASEVFASDAATLDMLRPLAQAAGVAL